MDSEDDGQSKHAISCMDCLWIPKLLKESLIKTVRLFCIEAPDPIAGPL